jgi:hypothetical protein
MEMLRRLIRMEQKRFTGKMKIFTVALILLAAGVIVTITLCTEKPASAQGGPGRYSLNKYLPSDEGITWNYLQTYAGGGQNYEVQCFGGTETVGGEQTIKHWEFDSGELDYGLIYAYDCMAWTREGLMIYKGVNSDGSYYIYNPPWLYLPRSIRMGETYTTNTIRTDYDTGGTPTGSVPFSMTLTLEAEEDMQVLAGNFSDCLRLSGTENEEGVISDVTLWLAYGMGEVKKEFEDEERELISFTDRGTTYHPTD